MAKLTAATRRSITDDWHARFPSLAIYEPMHLLRRCGPVLQGIALNPGSDRTFYDVVWHIHNLCFPHSSIVLAPQKKAGLVPVASHTVRLATAVERVRAVALLPLDGPVGLTDVLSAYREYLKAPLGIYEPDRFAEMAGLCTWAGRPDLARSTLAEARAIVSSWPERVLDAIGGLEPWIDKVTRITTDRDQVSRMVLEQERAHRAELIPREELGS